MNRRSFLHTAGGTVAGSLLPTTWSLFAAQKAPPRTIATKPSNNLLKAPDHTLTIKPCTLEISPGVAIETIAYDGQVPGPLLRLKQGVTTTIDVLNQSPNEEIVHWHGLTTDSANDGAMEEGSPMIPAGGRLRYTLTPNPAGLRWYHTHATARDNLSLAGYTGQFGFLLVDDGKDPGLYDQEVFLAIHHWEPSFVPMVEKMQAESANHPQTSASDVGYKYATVNAHRLGAGEPIRVRQGQQVLFRILNASATENVILSLPGHTFRVISMDGNPVPNPREVETLSVAVAERIEAIVEMKTPGVWILGSTLEKSRGMGLGVVVEYAGKSGPPMWKDPKNTVWDYSQFANVKVAPVPDDTIPMALMDLGRQGDAKFDTWAINGKSWPDSEPIKVQRGKRYRLLMQNTSGDQHPMHLHRHSFEVVQVGGKNISGLMKDTVNVMPLDTVAVDFVANNPGDSLMHCHMQLHMDFGFMQLIRYV